MPMVMAVWLCCMQVEMKLKAESNILLRSNSRLKADQAASAAKVDGLTKEVAALKQQLLDAAAVADKLRGELAERDGVIGDNYATLQGLRRRVQELETHKFVLGYKVGGCCQPEVLVLTGGTQGCATPNDLAPT